MSQIRLQGPGIAPGVGQGKPASVPQHVGVGLERLWRHFDAEALGRCTLMKNSNLAGRITGNSAGFSPFVRAAEPPTELAVDILHHHHIPVDVGLVVCVGHLEK